MSETFHKNKKVKQKFQVPSLESTSRPCVAHLLIFLSSFTAKLLKGVDGSTVFTSTSPLPFSPHTWTWLLSSPCHWNCSDCGQQHTCCPMILSLFSSYTAVQRVSSTNTVDPFSLKHLICSHWPALLLPPSLTAPSFPVCLFLSLTQHWNPRTLCPLLFFFLHFSRWSHKTWP